MLNEDAIDIILKAIEQTCAKLVDGARFDVTKRGFVCEVTDEGYVVLIEGQSYLIRSPDNYAVGDTVRVLFEQNNPNNRSILGKVT